LTSRETLIEERRALNARQGVEGRDIRAPRTLCLSAGSIPRDKLAPLIRDSGLSGSAPVCPCGESRVEVAKRLLD